MDGCALNVNINYRHKLQNLICNYNKIRILLNLADKNISIRHILYYIFGLKEKFLFMCFIQELYFKTKINDIIYEMFTATNIIIVSFLSSTTSGK